jgi:hypothetical protein
MPHSSPFWLFRVREKRDFLALRQKARQIAHLLHFPPLEEACVAAGVFAIAAQARETLGECEICFQLEQHQLTVQARAVAAADANAKTSDGPRPLLKLAKPLPEAARHFSAEDLGFLIARINDNTPAEPYAELCKQNQEVLLLLHLLQTQHQAPAKPSAA